MPAAPESANVKVAPPSTSATVRTGLVYLDLQRRVLHPLNDAARQLLAEGVPFKSADLARRPLLTMDGKLVTRRDLPLARARKEGQPVEAQFLLPRDSGTPLHLRWVASPTRDINDRIIGILATVIAGTPEPDWQILAGLAHDLRTPLQSLGLLLELAEGSAQDADEIAELLPRLRASADRAMNIALDLLDWCRGPGGRTGRLANRAWLPLEPFLIGLSAEHAIAAKHKSLALVTNVAAARGWEAHTDRLRLGRLLSNLLVNAIRYTRTGQVEFTASWREDRGGRDGAPPGRRLALSIVDTGAGIPVEDQESIFQPFERGRAGKEGDSSGSGLGLAIVDRLVEELGLELEVYSEYGRGSAFHLLLPGAYLRMANGAGSRE
jgi:signal transduction histidine kinase